jgi:rubredoxin
MRMFECENCHSIFIVNEGDERVRSGDYTPDEKLDCPLCSADMIRFDRKPEEEQEG